MKKYLFGFTFLVILSSCSSPKNTYYFDHYDYKGGKKNPATHEGVAHRDLSEVNLAKTMVASTNKNDVYPAEPLGTISKEEAVARIKSMSKEEKIELKREIKRIVKEKKSGEKAEANASKGMENDVKLAAIFGAVGFVLLLIGGELLSVLGAIALLIGLYFFIRWLIHQ